MEDDNDLKEIFLYYTNGKSDIECKQYHKFIRENKLMDKKFTNNDIDIVFAKVKEKGFKTIDFNQFKKSIEEIARKKGQTKDTILRLNLYNTRVLLIKEYKLDNKLFLVRFKTLCLSNIYIKCCPKDIDEDIICLDEYYVELSYNEFMNFGKSFKQCDDISQVMNLLKKVLDEIEFSDGMRANSRLEYKNDYDKTFILFLRIPLLSGNYEDIRIEFKKKRRDINVQFELLKNRFLELKNEK